MTNNIKVPLGKKDGLLRYWWEKAQDKQLNISKAVVAALEYYMLTGDFLELAVIESLPVQYEDAVIKWVYISPDNGVYEWLENRQKNGEKLSTIIKFVLRNSINRDGAEFFNNNDELFKVLEKHKNNHKLVSNQVTQQPTEIRTIEVKEIPKYDSQSTWHESAIEPEVFEEDDAEINIFDQLLGGNGLDLG